jgi:MarR family transcriptional regulator, organic hydroperoxide resistance regulator
MDGATDRLMALYPRIFFACHRRHVRDPRTGRLVSEHQAQILDHLDQVEPMTLSSLAEHMGVTPGTMSVGVDRLVRKGYVRRVRDRLDARRVNLRLSPAGARLRENRSVLDPAAVEALLAHLSTDEQERALEGLSILARAAGELMKRRAGAGRHSSAAGDSP